MPETMIPEHIAVAAVVGAIVAIFIIATIVFFVEYCARPPLLPPVEPTWRWTESKTTTTPIDPKRRRTRRRGRRKRESA